MVMNVHGKRGRVEGCVALKIFSGDYMIPVMKPTLVEALTYKHTYKHEHTL